MPESTKLLARRKLTPVRLEGYTGQESCIRAGEPDCKIVGAGTRFYGEPVCIDGAYGWSGNRGPFCSAACYYREYPHDPRLPEPAPEPDYVEVDQISEYGGTFRLQRSVRVF